MQARDDTPTEAVPGLITSKRLMPGIVNEHEHTVGRARNFLPRQGLSHVPDGFAGAKKHLGLRWAAAPATARVSIDAVSYTAIAQGVAAVISLNISNHGDGSEVGFGAKPVDPA